MAGFAGFAGQTKKEPKLLLGVLRAILSALFFAFPTATDILYQVSVQTNVENADNN